MTSCTINVYVSWCQSHHQIHPHIDKTAIEQWSCTSRIYQETETTGVCVLGRIRNISKRIKEFVGGKLGVNPSGIAVSLQWVVCLGIQSAHVACFLHKCNALRQKKLRTPFLYLLEQWWNHGDLRLRLSSNDTHNQSIGSLIENWRQFITPDQADGFTNLNGESEFIL